MNNEEKILDLLQQQGKVLDRHSELLSTIQADVSDLKDRVGKIEITQENIVLPQLQALAEGHKVLLDTLAPKNRVEALEDEMAFMKSVIKALSQEVAELKKAQ